MSENILFLGKKMFEIPPFLQTRPGDLGKKVHACSLCFSARSPRIRHRNELTEEDLENAVQGLDKAVPFTSLLVVCE